MYYKDKIDQWLTHRFKEVVLPSLTAPAQYVIDLLPEGWDSLYNGLAGEAITGDVQYPILVFEEAGIVPIGGVIGIIKDGVSAQYYTRVYHADPAFDGAGVILSAVDDALIQPDGNGVSEVYNGLAFHIMAQTQESGDVNISQAGRLYSRAGLKWLIDVDPAT